MNQTNRRTFLQRSAMAVGMAGLLGNAKVLRASSSINAIPLDEALGDDDRITSDPRVKQVLQRAVDAAVSEGAGYAEARLTHTRFRDLGMDGENAAQSQRGGVSDREEITIGVRALVDGYWGFASGPVWLVAEGERLGKAAANQARVNTLGKKRETSLAPNKVVRDGSWTMPVLIDPFTVHPDQLHDILRGVLMYARTKPGIEKATSIAKFVRQDRAVASSEGTWFCQRTYSTSGTVTFSGPYGDMTPDFLTLSGLGFELLDEDRLRASIDPLLEESKWNASLPVLPLDVGRYETVLNASSVASLLSESIGAATELDRALGFEANAGGTSYLNDPVEMLGTHIVGSKLLSIDAERSTPGWLATVRWDDEGVVPITTPIVTNGVLTNYQTTREHAAWIAAAKSGVSAQSAGCAYAPFGGEAPLTHTANLRMHAGAESQDFESLVKTVKKGVAVKSANVQMDFQQLNGFISNAIFYSIMNGKIVARLVNAGVLFRSPELWKGVSAIGDESSRCSYGFQAVKGEPPQYGFHTTSAVPVVHEGLTFIDPMRKA